MIKWIQGQLPSFEEVPTVITIKYPILQCYIAMSYLPAYLCHYRWEVGEFVILLSTRYFPF